MLAVIGAAIEIEGRSPEPEFIGGLLGALPVLSGETQTFLIKIAVFFPDESVGAWRAGSFPSFEAVIAYTFLGGTIVRRFATRKLVVPIVVDDIAWKE